MKQLKLVLSAAPSKVIMMENHSLRRKKKVELKIYIHTMPRNSLIIQIYFSNLNFYIYTMPKISLFIQIL